MSQRAIPLLLTLDKVGHQKPADVNRIEITAAQSGETTHDRAPVLEAFAPAQFQEMSDAEKLSRPSFEKLPSGVVLSMGGGALKSSKMTKRKIAYELTTIDKEPVKPLGGALFQVAAPLFFGFLGGAAVSRSKLSHQYKTQMQPFAEKVAVVPEGYTVAFTLDNKACDGASSFASHAMAVDCMKRKLAQSPGLKGSLHVIPNHEVNTL